ncbi:hypothetical protein FIA58_000775 [Flavobacterium jejuense]|uniref:Uncharacterized protein n=1 Tax=Flavobacterium jejuense TaxID=1544455 RepID=A0ABX0ILT8_9FLAO|nr:hypothetical protein [Flavobacterium jejuense]NHN24196.1 hypothetical protein [Flavobacterium jejuense]
MKTNFTVLSLFLLTIGFSQNEITKRKAFTLEIVADTEHNYEMDVKETPYFVKEKALQIYPSETLLIQTEIKADTIYSMKIVDKITIPEQTISIKLSLNAEDRSNVVTSLVIKNPFSKKLFYNAMIYSPISQKWEKTNIIPIAPKLMSIETWPYSIITIVLDNWSLE